MLSLAKFALISSKRLLMLAEKMVIILLISAIMVQVEVVIGSIWSLDTRCQGLGGGVADWRAVRAGVAACATVAA